MSVNLADRPRRLFQPGRGPRAAVGEHARPAADHDPKRRGGRDLGPRRRLGSARRRSSEFDVGDEVVALGRVRRRFFRAGAGTGSRVEIEASHVVPAHDRRRVQAAVRRATAALDEVLE